MKRYAFYSPLPPEDYLKALHHQAAQETEELAQWHGEEIEKGQWKAAWKFEWDGEVITLNCTRSERIEEQGAHFSASLFRLSFFMGKRSSWNTCWGEPFRGRIEPDKRGGSILLGRFHMLPGSILSMILLLAGISVYLINRWSDSTSRMMGIIAAAMIAVWSMKTAQKVGENPLSKETLEFLKRNSNQWEIRGRDRREAKRH